MAASVRFITDRMVKEALNQTAVKGNRTGNPFFQTATNRTGPAGNSTFNLISNLVFAESKSVRTSTIILASFNVLAAFATACSILYDCYWASKRCNPKFKASKFCISSIHPAETFPLVLAIAIVFQGLVFAAVQGQGLESLFAKGCSIIAQYMWPALFIVPYTQVVFGLECALRSLREIPFQARGKFDVTICCATVVILLVITWIPSHIWPENDQCFASLIWFISKYGKLGFVLLSITSGLMIVAALTIFARLSTVNLIDQHQRIAASRMVYYMVLAIMSLAFVIPFFFSLIDKQGDIKLGMMATVVLNLSGLMSGLLQLFLRSNTATTSFAPKAMAQKINRGKHDIRIFGPNELAMHAQLTNPVTGPRTDVESRQSHDSQASLMGLEKGRRISLDSLRSPQFGSTQTKGMPAIPSPTLNASECPAVTSRHIRKASYSIFPPEGSDPIRAGQKDSIYDISELTPPPRIQFGGMGVQPRHRRESSIASSATVQIGLRISHAPSPSQEDIQNLPLPNTTYKAATLAPPSPASSYAAMSLPSTTYSASKPILPITPLKVQTSFPPVARPTDSPRRPMPSPLNTNMPQESPRLAVNKTLPPTPKFTSPQMERAREPDTLLSPTVYSPQEKKTASNPLRANPLGSPKSGTSQTTAPVQRSKEDWI